MKKTLHFISILLLYSLLASTVSIAQDDQPNYTANNRITVAFEGINQRYEFTSNQLLVRLNKETQRLECVLPVASLLPAQEAIPAAMAYDVLFGAKYPELLISIWLPGQYASTGIFTPFNDDRTASITLQGVNNDTRVPVALLPDQEQAIYFSTNFDLLLNSFQASIPAKYLPLLTGRIQLSIDRAYWYNLGRR